MNKSRTLSALFVVLALLAASCGKSRDVSADTTVEVPVDTVAVEDGNGGTEAPAAAPLPGVIEVTERDPSVALATIEFPDGSTVEVSGEVYSEIIASVTESERFAGSVYGGSFNSSDEGFIAGQLILTELFKYSMEDLGVEPEPGAVEESKVLLTENLAQAMATEASPETAAAEVAAEVAPYLNALAELIARQEAISAGLTEGAAGTEVQSYCSRHILVDTNELALDLIDQIEAGADFGETAAEFSTDPGSGPNGGDLLCNQAEAFVQPFSEAMVAAEIDAVVGPVESEFGFHIIQVYEVKTETIQADPGELFSVLMDELVLATTVNVDPVVGTWNPESLSVIAPG